MTDDVSPNTPLIAITGATGKVGSRVARRLAGTVRLRLFSRDVERAEAAARALPRTTAAAEASAAALDFADQPGAVRALEGVDVVLMVSAEEASDRLAQHAAFIRAARAAGVGQIVYTSFFAAAPDAVFTLARDHFATEKLLADSGVPHTILRDNFYQDVFPLFAGDDHLLRGPAAEGRVSAVARDDVAAVAAVVLAEAAVAWAAGREPVHAGHTYDLTGPEAFDLHQAAAVMTEVTGVQTRYLHETVAEALASRDGLGAPDWQMDAWISTYTAIASGELEPVSADVERLLGRPAQSLRRTLERLQD
ncbi:NAD(P)H-binding protein [Arthrobacter sp. AOP36-A1-22]|uniref:NAD(P)H-binding protein n=1 Tax=unclassified Arthrobacter TaxID=235627 RepID=UPI0040342851